MTATGFTASIRVRDSQANSANAIAEFGNTLFKMFSSVGMVKLTEAEDSGQCKKLVTVVADSSTETLVTMGTTSTINLVGYQVFRHPVLNLCVKVMIYDIGYHTSSRYCGVRYQIKRNANDTNFIDFTQNMQSYADNIATNVIRNSFSPIYSYMDNDTFWIGSDLHLVGYNATSLASFPVDGMSFTSLCLCRDDTARKNLIFSNSSYTLTNYGAYDARMISEYSATVGRDLITYSHDIASDTFSNFNTAGVFSKLQNPYISSNENGIRVDRASAILSGKTYWFNFGTINGAVLGNGAHVQINLNGEKAQFYKGIKTFGSMIMTPATNHTNALTLALMLPWVES